MKLIHSIASYTGDSRRNMEQILNDEAKDIIVRLSQNPQYAKQVDIVLLKELVDMGVFYILGSLYKPNTAVFLRRDIEYLTDIVFSLSSDMVKVLQETVKDFPVTSPNNRNFIYVLIAMGQGLHDSLKKLGAASEWQTKTGKYEKSRVDFNEDCDAYHAFGKDLQNKNVIKGNNYTSVTVGYEFNNLSVELVDSFPLLILGKVDNNELKQAAQSANIDFNDKFSVITYEQSKEYQVYIDRINEACSKYYCGKLKYIENALRSTTSGKGGAPTKNMMMNFWRYMRKAIAIKLYESGFLTDKILQVGNFTIFYENKIGYFN